MSRYRTFRASRLALVLVSRMYSGVCNDPHNTHCSHRHTVFGTNVWSVQMGETRMYFREWGKSILSSLATIAIPYAEARHETRMQQWKTSTLTIGLTWDKKWYLCILMIKHLNALCFLISFHQYSSPCHLCFTSLNINFKQYGVTDYAELRTNWF